MDARVRWTKWEREKIRKKSLRKSAPWEIDHGNSFSPFFARTVWRTAAMAHRTVYRIGFGVGRIKGTRTSSLARNCAARTRSPTRFYTSVFFTSIRKSDSYQLYFAPNVVLGKIQTYTNSTKLLPSSLQFSPTSCGPYWIPRSSRGSGLFKNYLCFPRNSLRGLFRIIYTCVCVLTTVTLPQLGGSMLTDGM